MPGNDERRSDTQTYKGKGVFKEKDEMSLSLCTSSRFLAHSRCTRGVTYLSHLAGTLSFSFQFVPREPLSAWKPLWRRFMFIVEGKMVISLV